MKAKQDDQLKNFLAGIVAVVEATSFEQFTLRQENARREKPRTWKQESMGLLRTVGWITTKGEELPITLSLSLLIATVDDRRILFYHSPSRVVDHDVVREWLEKNLPKTAFRTDGYINNTDAGNFHIAFSDR